MAIYRVGVAAGATQQAIASALTGNASGDTIDRGTYRGAGALVVTSTVGATPTVKLDIQGSVDGTNWYNVAYALVATPETVAVAQITITTAVTTTYLLRPDHAWRYLRPTLSVNTNVTIDATYHQ